MNKLEKLFSSVESSPKAKKARCVDECILQLREYVYDFPAYILKRVHALLASTQTEDRRAGYAILKSLRPHIEMHFDFREIQLKSASEYYSSAVSFAEASKDIKSQKAYIKEKFKLDIKNIVVEEDFAVESSKITVMKKDVAMEIENVYDFFTLLEYNLLSSEWHKRHGSFLAYIALLESDLESASGAGGECSAGLGTSVTGGCDEPVLDRKALGSGGEQRPSPCTIATITLTPDLVSIVLEILHEDKFNDFINDQTIAPVREAASYLLSLIYPTYPFKGQLLHFLVSFLHEEDWQVQFSVLIALKYLRSMVQLPTVVLQHLCGSDEDVKYLAASILLHYVDSAGDTDRRVLENVTAPADMDTICSHLAGDKVRILGGDTKSCSMRHAVQVEVCSETSVHYDQVLGTALEALRRSSGISLSYASLLRLICRLSTVEIDNELVWSCFRYPIKDVRLAILDCLRLLQDRTRVLKKLAQNVLIEESEDVRALSETRFCEYYRREDTAWLVGVLARKDLFYSRGDFGGVTDEDHDDLYFNLSGVKTLGRERIWEGRCRLLRLVGDVGERVEPGGSLMGIIFGMLLNLLGGRTETCAEVAPEEVHRQKLETLLSHVDSDIRPFRKELRRMEAPDYVSVHPRAIELYDDICKVRCCLELETRSIGVFTYRVLAERSAFSSLVCFLLAKLDMCDSPLTMHMYKTSNRMFFREIGARLVECAAYEEIVSEGDLHLFSEIVEYVGMENAEWAFEKAMAMFDEYEQSIASACAEASAEQTQSGGQKRGRRGDCTDAAKKLKIDGHDVREAVPSEQVSANPCARIVNYFIRRLRYNEVFVRRMLERLNVPFLSACMGNSEPSFNVLFVKPLLKHINGGAHREAASDCLSRAIPTLAFSTNAEISDDLRSLIDAEKRDIEELYTARCKEYKIRCPMRIELRPYQVEGINWLYFLHRFQLSGILGDDMGLGKTIQVLTLICSEMFESSVQTGRTDSGEGREAPAEPTRGRRTAGRRKEKKTASRAEAGREGSRRVLVVCPSSLVGHWKSEIERYFPFVTCEIHSKKAAPADILVLSYDAYRNDYKTFTASNWFYVVLDEGHVLRNKDTVLYSRIQLLRSDHKILLSGTPVQNEAQDLVNLFHILMPGYLKMAELRVLHKRVLPFVLRRLKGDVLSELPPKIIRDVVVAMDSSQREAYNSECAGESVDTRSAEEAQGDAGAALLVSGDITYGNVNRTSSSFARIQRLLKLCSTFKLGALEDLLVLMGGNEMKTKALVFCQLKSTIDMVAKHVSGVFASLKHLRLDGNVPPKNRQKLVADFNTQDYSILFLTTQIGGLGLNLTGADTVILYEHDWNPFNDLQAMDRAHRLGQKKTVNVFRIILKDTIEEKVMSYQNFKMYVANALVNYENKDVSQMDLKDTLERFKDAAAAEEREDSDPSVFLH